MTMSTPADESLTAKTSRKSKNCWAGFMACCSDTKENATIKKIEYNISARQRQFGEEYMKLVDKDASAEELQACVDKATAAINKMKDDIALHESNKDSTHEQLEKKIVKDPVPLKEEQPLSSGEEVEGATTPASVPSGTSATPSAK